MNRETRSNLIFLVILLAVMVPGAVLLFRKKLEPTSKPMYLPDPVPHAVAHMVPGPTPPGMSRVEPPRTAAWVRELAREHAAAGTAPLPGQWPLISEQGVFQVVAVANERGATAIWVLLWRGVTPGARWRLETEQASGAGSVQAVQTAAVPNLVREELGEHGLLRPPKNVVVQEVRFAGSEGSSGRLILRGASGGMDIDSVPLFTNSVITSQYKNLP